MQNFVKADSGKFLAKVPWSRSVGPPGRCSTFITFIGHNNMDVLSPLLGRSVPSWYDVDRLVWITSDAAV